MKLTESDVESLMFSWRQQRVLFAHPSCSSGLGVDWELLDILIVFDDRCDLNLGGNTVLWSSYNSVGDREET